MAAGKELETPPAEYLRFPRPQVGLLRGEPGLPPRSTLLLTRAGVWLLRLSFAVTVTPRPAMASPAKAAPGFELGIKDLQLSVLRNL